MIIDVPLTYSIACFVPRKHNPELVHLTERYPVAVREASDDEAPVVASFRLPAGAYLAEREVFRFYDGAFWSPKYRNAVDAPANTLAGVWLSAERFVEEQSAKRVLVTDANFKRGRVEHREIEVEAKDFQPSLYRRVSHSRRDDAILAALEDARDALIVNGVAYRRTTEPTLTCNASKKEVVVVTPPTEREMSMRYSSLSSLGSRSGAPVNSYSQVRSYRMDEAKLAAIVFAATHGVSTEDLLASVDRLAIEVPRPDLLTGRPSIEQGLRYALHVWVDREGEFLLVAGDQSRRKAYFDLVGALDRDAADVSDLIDMACVLLDEVRSVDRHWHVQAEAIVSVYAGELARQDDDVALALA